MDVLHSIRMRLANWSLRSGTARRLRERRYRLFIELCRVRPHEAILDVGAGAGAALARFNKVNPIVAVDLRWPDSSPNWLDQPNVRFVHADATSLPFADRAFPIAFSNAVVQLVPTEKRATFADEIRRVSDRYFVQTQNKWFPVQSTGTLVPFVHLLPRNPQRWFAHHIFPRFPKESRWEPLELLGASELRALFPDAEIHRERVMGLTKSLMAVRRLSP
jgi:SAM-dependent methyltransferase